MIWKILRPHYWILDRRVRSTNPIAVLATLLLLLWGGQWLYDNAASQYLMLLSSEQAMTAVAASLPVGIFFILLFAMLSFGDVLHQLYLAPDLELLMAAPIPFSTIFLVKLMQCSRGTFIPALGFGTFLAALGLARNAPASYFLLIGLLTLLFMLMATAVVMILVVLLARWLPAQRSRSWMPVLAVLLTLALMLGQQSATRWFLNQAGLITFFSGALFSSQKLSLVLLGLGGLAVTAYLGALRIFVSSFHEGWNRYGTVPTGREIASQGVHRPPSTASLAALLPSPLRFILGKEWRELRRSPRALLNLAQPLVLVVATLTLFSGVGKGVDMLRPFIFYAMLAFLALFLTTQPIGTSLMSVAQEGRNIHVLRGAPISMSQVLRGKFWATWVPVGLSWAIVFLAAGVLLRFQIWQTAFLVGIALWGLAGASIATLAIAGLKVDFLANDLRQRTSAAANYLAMGLNGSFALLTMATSMWLIIHFYPESHVVLAVRGITGYSAVKWIFSDQWGVPLGLLVCQAAFWVGIKLLWDSAAGRLESFEAS